MTETPPGSSIRIFVLDDHELVRSGLRTMLEAEPDMEVVGEAGTAAEAMRRIPAARPDVAVLDMRLPDGNGIEVCRDIRSRMPQTSCVILTSYADDEALFSAIMAGASGYVLKEVKAGNLIGDLRRVAGGASLLDPVVTQRVLERMRKGPVQDELVGRLTGQERKTLDLIAEGRTNRQIADELYLAEKTVKNYVTNILTKMGMTRRTEAAVYATRLQERRGRAPGTGDRSATS